MGNCQVLNEGQGSVGWNKVKVRVPVWEKNIQGIRISEGVGVEMVRGGELRCMAYYGEEY